MTEATLASDRVARIRGDCEAVFGEVRTALAKVSDADRTKETTNPGWTAGMVVVHMATAPGQVAPFAERVVGGKWVPPFPAFTPNLVNRLAQFRKRKATGPELVADFDNGSARVLKALDQAEGADWDREYRLAGNTLTVESFFDRIVVEHLREHLDQLRSAVPDA
jgi:hypothetical protein